MKRRLLKMMNINDISIMSTMFKPPRRGQECCVCRNVCKSATCTVCGCKSTIKASCKSIRVKMDLTIPELGKIIGYKPGSIAVIESRSNERQVKQGWYWLKLVKLYRYREILNEC